MRIALLLACLLIAAGCSSTSFGDSVPYPAGCEQVHLDATRCKAAVDAAAAELGLSEADIAAVDLLTEDRCGDDRTILCSRSSSIAYAVCFTLPGGRMAWNAVDCIVNVPRPYCPAT